MVKSNIILLTFCLAISTIFQAACFPAFEYEDIVVPTSSFEYSEEVTSPGPLPTIEDIEEIMTLDDEGEKMKRLQKYGVEQAEHLLKFAQKTVSEVDDLVKQLEIAITKLKVESKDLDLEKLKFTNDFISKFSEAKIDLLSARRDLVTLASETVLLCDNIEIVIKDWQDEHAAILLKTQFKDLRRLIETTKKRLSFAREKYAALIHTFLTMNEDIAIFKVKLDKMSDTNSAEYKRWSSNIRAVYISSSSAHTSL